MSEPESHFVAICPRCSITLKVRRTLLGQMVACKQCGHAFVGALAEQSTTRQAGSVPGEIAIHAWPEPPRVVVVCDKCKASLSVKSSRIGQVIRCKQCDQEILVKAPGDAIPSPVLSGAAPSSAAGALSSAAARGQSDGQLQALRSKHEFLQAELEKLSVAHNLLEAEADRLRQTNAEVVAENEPLRKDRDELAAELNSVRSALSAVGERKTNCLQGNRATPRFGRK